MFSLWTVAIEAILFLLVAFNLNDKKQTELIYFMESVHTSIMFAFIVARNSIANEAFNCEKCTKNSRKWDPIRVSCIRKSLYIETVLHTLIFSIVFRKFSLQLNIAVLLFKNKKKNDLIHNRQLTLEKRAMKILYFNLMRNVRTMNYRARKNHPLTQN